MAKAKEGRFDVAALLAFWHPAILRQYLYFGTSEFCVRICTLVLSKGRFAVAAFVAFWHPAFCASICTFLLVKQVNQEQGRFSAAAFLASAPSYSAPVFVLLC